MTPTRPKRTRLRSKGKANQPSLTDADLKSVEAILGHKFKTPDTLIRALTHPSAVSSADSVRLSNQRLEFWATVC